jgi:hypothetical protein
MAVPIPNVVQPFVDPKTGIITQAWRQYLLNLGSAGSSDVDVIVAFLQGMTFEDAEARKMAQDALLMALIPGGAGGGSASQTIYMPMVLSDGTCVIAPDGRLIPTLWGTL